MKNKEALEALDRIDETLSFMRNMMNEPDELVLLNIPSFKADMDGIIKDFRAHGARIRSALTQPEQEWQPIDTAPRDGTSILVCQIQASTGVFKASYHQELDAFQNEIGIGFFCQDGCDTWPIEPTHWMPLPNSPIDK